MTGDESLASQPQSFEVQILVNPKTRRRNQIFQNWTDFGNYTFVFGSNQNAEQSGDWQSQTLGDCAPFLFIHQQKIGGQFQRENDGDRLACVQIFRKLANQLRIFGVPNFQPIQF